MESAVIGQILPAAETSAAFRASVLVAVDVGMATQAAQGRKALLAIDAGILTFLGGGGAGCVDAHVVD